jgi:subtilisin family serine protease
MDEHRAAARPHRRRRVAGGLTALGLVLAAAPAAATTSAAPAGSETGPQARYVVVLKPQRSAHAARDALTRRYPGRVSRTYGTALHGFAAALPAAEAARLRADPAVAAVVADVRMQLPRTPRATSTPAASWGLDRIDARRGLDGRYAYRLPGAGVHAYVVDTGIAAAHPGFGGRADAVLDTLGGTGSDCNGHGTHVAGTIGGTTTGVARAVRLHALRVLGCDGSGYLSDVVYAVDWVTAHHVKPAVMNLSLGGPPNDAVDAAVTGAVARGVVVVVAAGNEGRNAATSSPGRAPAVLTVSATDAADTRAPWANYGSGVDLFAPGVAIRSLVPGGEATFSGTSMAAPHVAGVAARYLQAVPTAGPARVAAELTGRATGGLVRDPAGSPNRLLYGALDTVPTTLRVAASSAALPYGGALTVTGRLARADTAAVVAGVPVEVYARRAGVTGWALVATLPTDPAGLVRYRTTVTTGWTFTLRYRGGVDYTASASPDLGVRLLAGWGTTSARRPTAS